MPPTSPWLKPSFDILADIEIRARGLKPSAIPLAAKAENRPPPSTTKNVLKSEATLLFDKLEIKLLDFH